MCCMHVGCVVTENVLEVEPEYEEVVEEYKEEVLVTGVPEALADFPVDSVRSNACPRA